MHPLSHAIIGQILHPAGPRPGSGAVAAATAPFALAQVVQPRGPSALAAEHTVRIDSVRISPPAAV